MCGIAGAITREPGPSAVEVTSALTRALTHRGPDGSGFWTDTNPSSVISEAGLPNAARVVLGHRRLAIVDIAGGSQPLSNEDQSIWVSYNGEIFNAPDLRRDLIRAGHVFRSNSDTEVLVHGWEAWGEEMFGRLNGMFAFALAERDTGVVWIVRDPVGIKPVYVGTHGALTWWASELGAAREAGVTSNAIDRDALKLYLTFRFVPSPLSIFENAWKVPPGSFARLTPRDVGQRPTFQVYRSAIRSSAEPHRRSDWAAAMTDGLAAAVKRQLMSDVPVGSLLSGGVDSSLVTMLMRDAMEQPPVAFGVGFSSHGQSSEIAAARRAATLLGVPLVERAIADAEYLEAWPESHRRVGEPVGNSSSLLLGMLCERVAQTHKVVLTGQGADEPLGGYPRHVSERLYQIGRRAPVLSAAVAQRLLGSDAGERLRRVLSARGQAERYAEILTVISATEVDALVPGGRPARELAAEAVARWIAPDSNRDPLNALLKVDASMSLADDLLLVADHFSMAASVELRVPFLDLELLELLDRMPSRYKISWTGRRKWLYREAAMARLPRALSQSLGGFRAERGKKIGFHTPVERWFNGPAIGSRWIEQLERVAALNISVARQKYADTRDPKITRQRLALFALAEWHG